VVIPHPPLVLKVIYFFTLTKHQHLHECNISVMISFIKNCVMASCSAQFSLRDANDTEPAHS